MLFVHHETEYEINVFCLHCGSKNVVLDYDRGFFHFEECLKCGFTKNKNGFNRNNMKHRI